MKEIKLTIDGKEVKLTEEQLKALNLTFETKLRNPFERVNGEYYCIKETGEIYNYSDNQDMVDNRIYDSANYFNDRRFTEQVALHQLLYRKLLKFAYDNECEDTAEWDGSNKHWAVRYDYACGTFTTYYQNAYGAQEVYFHSEEGARSAIKEVVEPFMKEHPNFVW